MSVPAAPVSSAVTAPLHLLVTRPAAQAAAWVARLRERGFEASALPLMAIEPAPEPERVRAMWAGLAPDGAPPASLVMFVSPNAAIEFFRCLPAGAVWPSGVRAAATGPGTVAALQAAGVPSGQIVAPGAESAQFESEALWALLSHEDWQGRAVWVVRGSGGRDWFASTLTQAGAAVQFMQAYQRGVPAWDAAQRALADTALAGPQRIRWLLSSSEAIGNLATLLPGADWSLATAVASHPRIAERARHLGFGSVVSVRPTLASVVEALTP